MTLARSSRSIATGPGSRGGQVRGPKYWRDWRSANPEYRAREALRTTLRRERAREATGGDVTITEVCRAIVREEAAASSQRRVAARLGIDHASISARQATHFALRPLDYDERATRPCRDPRRPAVTCPAGLSLGG